MLYLYLGVQFIRSEINFNFSVISPSIDGKCSSENFVFSVSAMRVIVVHLPRPRPVIIFFIKMFVHLLRKSSK